MYWKFLALVAMVAALGISRPVLSQAAVKVKLNECDARQATAKKIRNFLDSGDVNLDQLQQLAEQVRRETAANGLLQRVLAEASAPTATEESLRTALTEAAAILAFQPVEEAPVPEGFPPLTPVGEIRVCHYPAYRLARTPTAPGDRLAFWRLFRHIQSRDMAMTAPVEMTYTSDGDKPREAEMAFLYRHVEQGALGADGKVDVVDVPAITAVSIGWRGDIDTAKIAEASQLLATWLAERTSEYRPIGQLRVMGYNSPFVPTSKRYFEVQLPVAAKHVE